MSELVERIEAFLAKYPDDVPLEWQRTPAQQRRAVDPSLVTMVGDLVDAGDRHARRGSRS